jgi:hypothetical protein
MVNFNYNQTTMTTKVQYTSEQLATAELLIQEHNAAISVSENARELFIDVTGRRGVYFTLWVYNPMSRRNPFTYGGNLSTNLLKAVEKICTRTGNQVTLGTAENFNPNYPKEGIINFGKYNGMTLTEVYDADPNYILWFASKYEPKTQHAASLVDDAKVLAEVHWQRVANHNRETCTSKFIGMPKKRQEFELTVTSVKRFQSQGFGYDADDVIRHQYKCMDGEGNLVQFYIGEIENSIQVGERVTLTASVKSHSEICGRNWTVLTRVSSVTPYADKYTSSGIKFSVVGHSPVGEAAIWMVDYVNSLEAVKGSFKMQVEHKGYGTISTIGFEK